MYDCVNETIECLIPEEVAYLQKYDEMKSYLDDVFQMPDSMVALLPSVEEQFQNTLKENSGAFIARIVDLYNGDQYL